MDDLVIYPKRIKLVALVFLGIILVAASAVVIIANPQSVLNLSIGCFGVVFFGAALVFAIHRLMRPRPSLVVSRCGLIDRSSVVALGELEWSEIDRAVPYSTMGQSFLGIWLKDPERVIRRVPCWKAIFIRIGMRMGYPSVSISAHMVPMRLFELEAIINECLNSFRRKVE